MPIQVGEQGWLVSELFIGSEDNYLSFDAAGLNVYGYPGLDIDASGELTMDAGAGMALTAGAIMTFEDSAGGPYSLSQLVGAGSEIPIWVVTGSQANGTLGTSGIQYTPLPTGAPPSDTIQLQCRVDTAGTYTLKINYVMSAANANEVNLQSDHLAVDEGEDPDAALGGTQTSEFTPGNDTNMHQHEVFTYTVTAGEELTILITRIAVAAGVESAADFRFIDAVLVPAV